MSGIGKRGPPNQPSKQFYKCPVKDCNSNVRGDDIAKHFRTYANLSFLDKASENQSMLIKTKKAGESIEASKVYLESLLEESPNSEKEHTTYLLHHDYVSSKLPNYNSINFKCQQISTVLPIGATISNYFYIAPKKAKLSDNSGASTSTFKDDSSTSANVEEESEKQAEIEKNTDVPDNSENLNDNLEKNLDEQKVQEQETETVEKEQETEMVDNEEIVTKNRKGLASLASQDIVDWIADKVIEKLKKIVDWLAAKIVEKIVQVIFLFKDLVLRA